MAYRPARSGAEGNTRLQNMYGAGSTPPHQSYPKGYAAGGAVKGFAIGGAASADGSPAKPNLARPGRKMAGKGKKGGKGTNVNVIVMPKGDGPGGPPMMLPPGPMAGPPPSGPPMPMPPPGPGGPPMPMRKHGGKVQAFKKGGRVKKEDGGSVSPGEQMQAARKRRDDEASERNSRASATLMNTAVAMGLAGVPGKFARILKHGNTGLAGIGALATGSSHGKKVAAEAEMKRLGEGKATQGEEDRKHGGRVGFKKGGRVKRADGGWTGEGDSGKAQKEKAAQLRGDAERASKTSVDSLVSGVMATGAGAMGPKMRNMGLLGKSLKVGALGSGIANLGLAGLGKMAASHRRREADAADKAGDEAEGRKHGGRIGKREGGPAMGLKDSDGGAGGAKGRLAKVRMYGK